MKSPMPAVETFTRTEGELAEVVDAALIAARWGVLPERLRRDFGTEAGDFVALIDRLVVRPPVSPPCPDPAFVNHLESRVLHAFTASPRRARRGLLPKWTAAWLTRPRSFAVVGAAAILAIVAGLTALSPQGVAPGIATASAATDTATATTPSSVAVATAWPGDRVIGWYQSAAPPPPGPAAEPRPRPRSTADS